MKLLTVGSDGRGHALVWKLAKSPHVTEMWCAPGSNAITEERLRNGARPVCVPIGVERIDDLVRFALDKKVDFTVVGPDNPLAFGIVDTFQNAGLKIWGPNRKAAQFESSKVFTQGFAERYGLPIAPGECFTSPEKAKNYVAGLEGNCFVKADGLAFGKGAVRCRSVVQANRVIDDVMSRLVFGEAGCSVVVQERLLGREFSLHALCDGDGYRLFPVAQDHKPLYYSESEKAPNTGGMGAYSPVPFVNREVVELAEKTIIKPWFASCLKEGIKFRGMLYPNLILTPEGEVKFLEFNARFGDPEAQVYLTRLQSDLFLLLWHSATGSLKDVEMRFEKNHSVCVVMTTAEYPERLSERTDLIIRGLEEVKDTENVKVFHAGTICRGGVYYVKPGAGRVLGVTAWADDLEKAVGRAYEAVSRIKFTGSYFRSDIGAKHL